MARKKIDSNDLRLCRTCGEHKPAHQFRQRFKQTANGSRSSGYARTCNKCASVETSKVFVDGDMTLVFKYPKNLVSDANGVRYTFEIFRHILEHGYIKLSQMQRYTRGCARAESAVHFITYASAYVDGKKYVLYEDEDDSVRGTGFSISYKLDEVGEVGDLTMYHSQQLPIYV